MELKRYVLLENKTIINNRWGLWLRDSDNMVIDGVDKPHKIGVMIKTSDNILDLVEVGDLVEIESSVYLHRVYEQIYKGLNNQVLPYIYMNVHSESQYPLKDVNREVITAIYKRKPNGDYKRYEVK